MKMYVVELMHEDDGSGCSNLYCSVIADTKEEALSIIADEYDNHTEYTVTSAMEMN